MVQSTPFFIKIATPRGRLSSLHPIHFSIGSLLLWWNVFLAKKTKSALRFRHQTKMVLLLRKSLKPFTFSETNLKIIIIDQSNLLSGSGIAEIKNNRCRKKQGRNERIIASQLHNRNVFKIQNMDISYT